MHTEFLFEIFFESGLLDVRERNRSMKVGYVNGKWVDWYNLKPWLS